MLLAGAWAMAAGCDGCSAVDRKVSVRQGDDDSASAYQSETSTVRIDTELVNGADYPRYVVGYNDSTNTEQLDPLSCWKFIGPMSTTAWAVKDNSAADWVAKPQLSPPNGVLALHGDPWLAVWNSHDPIFFPNVVLYASLGQTGAGHREGLSDIVIARARVPNGAPQPITFEPPVLLFHSNGVDGTKLAIAGDGQSALAAWAGSPPQGSETAQVKYFFGITQPNLVIPDDNTAQRVDAKSSDVVTPLGPNGVAPSTCQLVFSTMHPVIAAGQHGYYLGAKWEYTCNGISFNRYEVWRSDETYSSWRRILSVEPPSGVVGNTILNAQDLTTGEFGTGRAVTRNALDLRLTAGRGEEDEFILLVTTLKDDGANPGETSRNRVIYYRLDHADTCTASLDDRNSCGIVDLMPRVVDDQLNPQTTRPNGAWEVLPAPFVGSVPDGAPDSRVGIAWYTQPYRGSTDPNVTAEMRSWTIVEAVVSSDGGDTFTGPYTLTTDTGHHDAVGDYFIPCQFLSDLPACSSGTDKVNGYFGDYFSGTFLFRDPSARAVLATWSDSREGCSAQGIPTTHQHVWSGELVIQ
jgi:hypothetical protein